MNRETVLFKKCNSIFLAAPDVEDDKYLEDFCLSCATLGHNHITCSSVSTLKDGMQKAAEKLKHKLPWELKGDTLYFYFT
jgi:hypothetical protein